MRVAFFVLVALLSLLSKSSQSSAQQVQSLPPLSVEATPSKPNQKKRTQPSQSAPSVAGSAPQPANAAPSLTVDTLDGGAGDVGVAQSSSQGFIPAQELLAKPAYRTGELLEGVPGVVVTQHSGEGKANQYFVRGFNIDHGTDLAIWVDGMPVNTRTHGHGQGWADTNFVIPEIVRGLSFRKGPYFASEGDFSSAAVIHLGVDDKLDKNFAQFEIGSFGHRRVVTGMSAPAGLDGTMLIAGEVVGFDGPWDRPDEFKKLNGVLRYSNGTYDNGFAVTAMAYSGNWYATDQIPMRAVEDGIIDRYGYLDPTDGGVSHRYSVSGRWHQTDASAATRVNAYLIKSDLSLYSNFTYFLNDPVNGDQFQQTDDRTIVGGSASKTFFGTVAGLRSETTVGIQGRYDVIDVGLFNTKERSYLSTVRADHVREASLGVFGEATLHWTKWLRTTTGLRADLYAADVESDLAANSGDDLDAILSPKAGIVLGPWEGSELYLNAGTGFHSNDARGTVTTIDPVSGDPVSQVPFLVRSEGAEIGVRTQRGKGFTSTLSAFVLDFDSETVFVGDAGTTEASRPSRRIGAEYTLEAKLLPWLTFDLDAAYTHARFTTDDLAAPGHHIPGAIEGVIGVELSFENVAGGWFGGVHVRYFGPRPLIEDNSVRSTPSTPVSARIGYKLAEGFTVKLDAFNLLDEKSSQIDYYYTSRLPYDASPDGVEDIHFHPLEPRSFRASLTTRW